MILRSAFHRIALAVTLFLQPAFASSGEISRVYCPYVFEVPNPHPYFQFRLEAKSKWRLADKLFNGTPERRVKIKTNIQRGAGQMGGRDESADASPPFTFGKNDARPAGLPAGTYWSNSGKYFYRSDTVNSGLRGGPRAAETFEFVFLHQLPDGRVLPQQGGYADLDSSWGWDGRFELQPLPNGSYELVVTQGAMELPAKMTGARPNAPDLPQVGLHNFSRSRHAFKPMKFEDGKLYVMDQGPILGNVPNANGDWIAYESTVVNGRTVNKLKSAHGYGENFFPEPHDARKLRKDEFGYPIRVFDMVVREVHLQLKNGKIKKIPATTRGIAYRMDPKNPSKRVPAGTLLPNGRPADEGIVVRTEELPDRPGSVAPSSIRMDDTSEGKILEVRTVNMDGTVTIEKDYQGPDIPITLVEGFNPVPGGPITFPSGKKYYLGTDSASEYTAGAVPNRGKKKFRYGSYLGYRAAEDGWLGEYRTVSAPSEKGEDFVDMLEDFTELYHLGWGAGRPQAYQDDAGRWWLDVHFVDADLLRRGLPTSGFPKTAKEFQDGYRRHKASIPIRWVERDGLPAFEIDDPDVAAAIEKYRAEKAENAGKPRKKNAA